MKNLLTFLIALTLAACTPEIIPPPPTNQIVPTSTDTITPTPVPTSTVMPSPTPTKNFSIIGYFPDYRDFNLDWGKYLTDIIYFSAEPRTDGTLDTSRLTDDIFQGLCEMKAKYGTRIYISIGGWDRSSGFAPMTAKPQTRQKFIQNVLDFAIAHNLDGVDIDWEFPDNDVQVKNNIALLTELQAALAPHNMIVTQALSSSSDEPLSNYSFLDRTHVMSYDNGPRHSTYDQAVKDMEIFVNDGFGKEKLFLGVPFYGRPINNPDQEFTYQEIVSKYHPAPNQDEMNGIYFNGIQTIQQKTCYAYQNGFGGVMIWELGQDTTDSTSLLQAIHQAVTNGCK